MIVKKTSVGALAMLFMLSLAFIAVAQETTKLEGVQSQIISGTIKELDGNTNTVTLETPNNEEMSFAVDSETKVTVGGQAGSLADLRAGQLITAELHGSKAKSVTIQS
jgi:hypothetical protein